MTYVGGGSPTPAKASYVIDGGAYFTATNVEDALSEIYEALAAGSPWWTLAVSGVMKEPTGVQNAAESTISFVDGTLTFTIAPTGANFDYYIQGLKYTSTGDAVVITDTEGTWYIYYAGDVLTSSQAAWDIAAANVCMIGILYWDATNNTGILVSDERHGCVMDAATHSWIHDTVGMRYASGGALTEGVGADEGKIALGSIVLHDEDLEVAVVNGTTGSAQWEQTLGDGATTWAAIPVFYRSGATGIWRRYTTTVYPYYDNGGAARINYNQYAAGTWSSTALPASDRYTAYWIFGTNNNLEPIIAIMGQGSISISLADARDENDFDDLILGDLPIPEMKVLYRLIYKSNAAGLGNPTLEDVTDYRVVAQISPSNSNAQDHASLAGLSADDHVQYLLDNGSRDILSGTNLDMYWTTATTLTGAIVGAHIDMVTNLTPNAQAMTALEISMPSTGAGVDIAIDISGAGTMLDLKPSGTGSEKIINIVPSAGLVAGSTWKAVYMDLDALDPATGANSIIMGMDIDATTIISADNDAVLYGVYWQPPASEASYGFYHRVEELTQNKNQWGFISYSSEALSTSANYIGFGVDWNSMTRDANAPTLWGIWSQLPADYTGFAAGSFAGKFEGDARSIILCDTTYALDISGATRTDNQITSTLAIGTAPFVITSTTMSTNLNADLLDGLHAADFAGGAHLHDGDTLQHDGVNSNGGAFSFSTTGAITFNQQQIYTHAVAGMMDLNPANTGTQNVIDITPSAALVAGSTWKGIHIDSATLDPATGAAGFIYGVHIDASDVISVDKNTTAYGVYWQPPTTEVSYGFLHMITEMTENKYNIGFYSNGGGAYSATASYRGVWIDWDTITRDGGAPTLGALDIDLPADYTDFGSSYAASFSGDGRSVVICDTDDAIGVVGDGETSGLIDIDPSGTGSQSIIDITPTAGIGAGSLWYGIKLSLADLDPATGVGSHVYGNYVDMTSMASVDGDVSAYGYYFAPCQADNSIGYYSQVPELDAGLMLTAFKTYHIQILSTTATYRGLHIDWDQLTRDANAPVIEGIRVEIAPDLSNFGTSFAGYFSGDGRTVTICDTTYALDISGAVRTNTQIASTLAIGTSPFAVTSTTVNTNLNADLWDGYQFTDYLDQAVKQASSPTFVGLSLSGAITGVTTFSAGTATFEVAADGYITTYPGMVIGADNYVLTYDHALGTLVLEVAAAGGGESLAATLAIGNETDGVSIIIDSAGDLLVYSDDKVTLKASIDGATGNTIVAGTFTAGAAGFDIDASGNIVDCGSIAMGGALTGVTTMSISDTVTMSEAVAQIVHSGATGMVVASTSGYVEIESVRFTGSTITGVGSMSLVGPITIGGDVVISHPAANLLLFSAGDFLGFTLGTYINEFSIDGTLTGNSDNALPTEQAVKTYVTTHAAIAGAHHPAPSDIAFAATWDAVTTIAPSKNAVYDYMHHVEGYPHAGNFCLLNGAVMSVWFEGTSVLVLPISDNNATFACTLRVPDNWNGTTGNLKIAYYMSVAAQTYAGLWLIGSHATGETIGAVANVLNNSGAYDFAAASVAVLSIRSIPVTPIAGGDQMSIRFYSDTYNNTACYITDVWLEP